MTLGEIAAAAGGSLQAGSPGTEVTSFGVDSRTIRPGGLFVAVRGERDGHDFAADAVERGASAVLVEHRPAALRSGSGVVVVDDTVAALARLAAAARDRLGDVPVVAITGSTGKTSTKDLTAAALREAHRVCASPASFNNELGVPLTLLSADERTGAVVAEIGARGPGEVLRLARVVRHRVGVVTTVGAAHTETFGSLAAVARAKGELLEALPSDGTAVVGTGHDHVDDLVARTDARALLVGEGADADVRVADVRVDGLLRPRFRLHTPWGDADVHLSMGGGHQAKNAALAAAAALAVGLDLERVVRGLEAARGSSWRMEVERAPSGLLVLNDAYNANPASTAAALQALGQVEVRGRRWAVLGQMAELGEGSRDEHLRVGRLAVEWGADAVVAVGGAAAAVADGARSAGLPAEAVVRAADHEEAWERVREELGADDAVLVKASRVVGLEHLAERLLEHAGRAPGSTGAPGSTRR